MGDVWQLHVGVSGCVNLVTVQQLHVGPTHSVSGCVNLVTVQQGLAVVPGRKGSIG